jgi:hypothetical protein
MESILVFIGFLWRIWYGSEVKNLTRESNAGCYSGLVGPGKKSPETCHSFFGNVPLLRYRRAEHRAKLDSASQSRPKGVKSAAERRKNEAQSLP